MLGEHADLDPWRHAERVIAPLLLLASRGSPVAGDGDEGDEQHSLVHWLPPTDGGDSEQQPSVRIHTDLGGGEWNVETGGGFAARYRDVAAQERPVVAAEFARHRRETQPPPPGLLALDGTHHDPSRARLVMALHAELEGAW